MVGRRETCGGTFYNGPEKRFVRCDRCGAPDWERNEGDKHNGPARRLIIVRNAAGEAVEQLRPKVPTGLCGSCLTEPAVYTGYVQGEPMGYCHSCYTADFGEAS